MKIFRFYLIILAFAILPFFMACSSRRSDLPVVPNTVAPVSQTQVVGETVQPELQENSPSEITLEANLDPDAVQYFRQRILDVVQNPNGYEAQLLNEQNLRIAEAFAEANSYNENPNAPVNLIPANQVNETQPNWIARYDENDGIITDPQFPNLPPHHGLYLSNQWPSRNRFLRNAHEAAFALREALRNHQIQAPFRIIRNGELSDRCSANLNYYEIDVNGECWDASIIPSSLHAFLPHPAVITYRRISVSTPIPGQASVR